MRKKYTCPMCSCKFVINKEDIHVCFNHYEDTAIQTYSTFCPECGEKIIIAEKNEENKLVLKI